MKFSYHFFSLFIAGSVFVGCEDARFDSVVYENIQSVNENSLWSLINKYDFAKKYEDKSANQFFRIGVGVMLGDYVGNKIINRLVNQNFDEITVGYEMKHGPMVKSNGDVNFAQVDRLFVKTKESGVGVFGHTLVWHSNQNAAYLNGLIAPVIIPSEGGPTLGDNLYTNSDFEGSVNSWKTNGSDGLSIKISNDGEGYEGKGKALVATNTKVKTNPYDSQIWYRFDPDRLPIGDQYEFSMNIRANKECTIGTQWHGNEWEYKGGGIGNISLTTEWQTITKTITVNTTVPIGALVFDLGKVDAAVYIDNISMRKIQSSGAVLEANLIVNNGFENGSISSWGVSGDGTVMALTSEGEGADGGKALRVNNPLKRNAAYESQVYYRFDPQEKWLKKGDEYEFKMDVKADVATSFGSQIHGNIGAYKGGFLPKNVDVTTKWQTVKFSVTLGNDVGGIVFDLGATATNYYFDNISMRRVNPYGGDQVIEKTPEQKKELIGEAMTNFISKMVTHCKEYVRAWDVVNEPMDDGSPYNLKTGIGKKLGADEFYWQDYLGKDYAVMAFKLAREYGNSSDKLFINDYNLEYSLDKCKGIIEYVKYIEENGAEVDGIGTQMHIGINNDKDKIVEMFKLLASTGKLIRISELDVRMGNSVELDIYQKQADMYRFVVDSYFKYIPANQRYGITVWGVNDGDPYWNTKEQSCLWDNNYQRKLSYKAFCDGLSGKENFIPSE